MKKKYYALLLTILILQACSEKVLIRRYYVLEFPVWTDTTQIKSEARTAVTCEILTVQVPPAYAQHRIAVRKRSHEISYYQYNYWAIDPAANLTSLLENQLEADRIFASLASGNLRRIPDYQISTYVYKIEALDDEDTFSAHLEMRMNLIEYASGKIVLYHKFNKTSTLDERDLNLFASEISNIFQEEIREFAHQIETYLSENLPGLPAE